MTSESKASLEIEFDKLLFDPFCKFNKKDAAIGATIENANKFVKNTKCFFLFFIIFFLYESIKQSNISLSQCFVVLL